MRASARERLLPLKSHDFSAIPLLRSANCGSDDTLFGLGKAGTNLIALRQSWHGPRS